MTEIDPHTLTEFIEYFERDLEKGFSADVACCDQCYEDFGQLWPHLERGGDEAFQRSQIGLGTFYSNSYLRDRYSEEEFHRYVAELGCPRCGSAFRGNIWVYSPPFNIPRDFEETLKEVNELARTTPFLLLRNPFCSQVLAAILASGTECSTAQIRHTLFRARDKSSSPRAELAAFEMPRPDVVKEGRYNHAGTPVLYLASDKETCHAELRHAACLAVEFRLLTSIKVLDLNDPSSCHEPQADLFSVLTYSAFLSAKQDDTGSYRPHYILSRFVADCARAAGFDAIKYPSTRRKGFNLVLLGRAGKLEGNVEVVAFHELEASSAEASCAGVAG